MDKRKEEVLLIGYGKMGKIYSKHLNELRVSHRIFDNAYSQHNSLSLDGITHVIVATPTPTHIGYYEWLRFLKPKMPLLIEKPVVDKKEDLYVFSDKNLYSGMCERSNKALLYCKETFNLDAVYNLNIIRRTKNPHFTYEEMVIHDLDIKDYFFPNAQIQATYRLASSACSSSLTFDGVYVDLTEQRVIGFENGKSVEFFKNPEPFTIKQQLINFLGGVECNAHNAHLKLFDNNSTDVVEKIIGCYIY